MRANEIAHVLDDTDYFDADALEHFGTAQRVADRHLLRRGHDHRAVQSYDLCERQLRVAGAGRQVHEEIIQLAPRDVAHELLDDFHDNRPAPDCRRVALDDESQRHQLYAISLERLNLATLHIRLLIPPEHPRNVGTVDVGVHQSD